MSVEEPSIAVFIDFENLALGARDVSGIKKFEIGVILKRLLEKGRVVYKRAYSDWGNYREDVRQFHTHGIELVDIPHSKMSGKNSADIRMVVDAMDLCHTNEHIDTFALISGDSDFSPLVSKLKENNKRVIGCGIRSSTSQLLVANCDEFLYYDDLVSKPKPKARTKAQPKASSKTQEKPAEKSNTKPRKSSTPKLSSDLEPVMEIITSLQEDYDPLWGSLIKQTVRRVHPGFSERQIGYRSFGELLEDLEKQGYIELDYDADRGNHKVSLADA